MAKDPYAKYRKEKKTAVRIDVAIDPEIAEAFKALAGMKGEDAIDIGVFLEDILRKSNVVKMAEELCGYDPKAVVRD